jgi:hypothetical protein
VGPLLLPALLMAMSLCAFTSLANAAALYKWVDENGQIRYSDRLPVNQVKKKHQQLNSQGMVLSTREAAKSDEELAAEAAAKLKAEKEAAIQAKIKEAQDKKDRVLLLTFSNENELGLTRNDRIEVLESVINLINKSIVTTQQTLQELQISADENYTSQDKEVPGGLAQKIEHFTRKIENRSAQLELKVLEKNKINEQYDRDLSRYRELKVQNSSN